MSPQRDRPRFPAGYGIATDEAGLLGWGDVAAALAAAPTYWLATVRPDHRPHLTPIWGAFVADRVYFEGGDATRWARNLAVSAAIDVGADHDGMQIMVRGRADRTTPTEDAFAAIADGYAAKYPYRPEPGEVWEVRPHTVLAWDVSSLDAFATTPTRFHFDPTGED